MKLFFKRDSGSKNVLDQMIYIYMVPPPKPMQISILLVFTVNFIYFGTDFVPIKFEAPTVGKLKN